MQRLGVSGAVRPIYGSLGAKGLKGVLYIILHTCSNFTLAGKSPLSSRFLSNLQSHKLCIREL
jgi:hypothetical protein